MPIYEFRCEECGKITEALVPMGDTSAVACASCGSKKTKRKFSTFGTSSGSSGSSSSSGPACTGFT